MRQRVLTAIVALASLAIVLFWLPPIAVQFVLALLVLAGAWEWSGFLDGASPGTRAGYVAVIAASIIGFSTVLAPYSEQLLLISLAVWLIAFLWIFAFPTPIPAVARWLGGWFVLVPMYTAVIHLYLIDRWILVFALLIVWIADSGAYFAGKFFGRVKLAPGISPGKTWEGVIGGMIAVALLAAGRAYMTEADWTTLVPFCLGVGVLSIVGDLTVSMFKRTAGVKDSGTLFPGHGGVLDRVDSIAAAAPLFAVGSSWVGLR